MRIEPGDCCERVILMWRDAIRECMDRLVEIEDMGVGGRGSSGDVRVQGGVRLPVEERHLFAKDRLTYAKEVILIAGALRDAPGEKARKYVTALLDGCTGAALRKRVRLPEREHRGMQAWLLKVVRRAMA
jgi:hypothetical protein